MLVGHTLAHAMHEHDRMHVALIRETGMPVDWMGVHVLHVVAGVNWLVRGWQGRCVVRSEVQLRAEAWRSGFDWRSTFLKTELVSSPAALRHATVSASPALGI